MAAADPHTPRIALDAVRWLSVYVLAVTVPLFALLPGPAAGRGFGWDFPMALGYAGLDVKPVPGSEHAWLGVSTSDQGDATVVRQVVAGSPAYDAGVSRALASQLHAATDPDDIVQGIFGNESARGQLGPGHQLGVLDGTDLREGAEESDPLSFRADRHVVHDEPPPLNYMAQGPAALERLH